MDDEAREAMREEGYDPDTPQIDRLWLMPADVEGDRHWSASPVTLWDVEYVRADLLADLTAKLAAAEARAERAEAALAKCKLALTASCYYDQDAEDAHPPDAIVYLCRERHITTTGGMLWRAWAKAIDEAFDPMAAGLAPADEPAGPAKGGRDGE
jgi:hypothetical protein